MGAGSSVDHMAAAHEKRSIEDVVAVMMPVYYTDSAVTETDHDVCQKSWDMILDDTSPHYIECCKDTKFSQEFGSCIMYFYDTFYKRLFDVHPMCKSMFKSGMKAQGKALVKIVTLSLSMFHDDDKFDAVLSKLAVVHNERGVKAVEYGIMGESLIWALTQVLGPEVMNPFATRAWIRVFCRMIKVIIPLAVAHEMSGGTAQKERMEELVRIDSARYKDHDTTTPISS